MWHKGIVTRFDKDKLDGHLRLSRPGVYHERIYFKCNKEQEQYIMRSFLDDVEIEIWLSGHENEVYNIIIDGKPTRKKEETV